MLKNTENIAETTENGKCTDIISELLLSMQVSGGVLLNESYAAPWAIAIPSHKTLSQTLANNGHTHMAAFHLVQQGFIDVELADGSLERVNDGEMVICFSGQAHTIYQGVSTQCVPFETLMMSGQNIFKPSAELEVQSTKLLCGVFQLHNTTRNPLFEALPPILKLSTKHSDRFPHPAIKTIIGLLLSELSYPSYSHDYIVGRYLELLCANSIGAYIESNSVNKIGWLQGIKNPMVAKVISAIHAQPEYSWSVANMAELSHLSPSRFAARFSQILGVSPMMYVTQWRMYLAGKLLRLPQSNIEKITATMGYENVAAFSRAFKRTMGTSPGYWRNTKT